MAVIRLSDGSLLIWSPIRLTEDLRAAVDAIGRVGHIVAPNSLHHLSLAEWKRAYPEATLHAPPGLRKKRGDIVFDANLGDMPSPDWAGQIDQVLMHGNLITTEAVFFHVNSGTVLFTDLLQQIPPDLVSGWRAVIAKLDLMVGPEPSVPRKFRIAFIDKYLSARVPNLLSAKVLRIFEVVYEIIDKTILILGFITLTTGGVTYAGIFVSTLASTSLLKWGAVCI